VANDASRQFHAPVLSSERRPQNQRFPSPPHLHQQPGCAEGDVDPKRNSVPANDLAGIVEFRACDHFSNLGRVSDHERGDRHVRDLFENVCDYGHGGQTRHFYHAAVVVCVCDGSGACRTWTLDICDVLNERGDASAVIQTSADTVGPALETSRGVGVENLVATWTDQTACELLAKEICGL